MNLTREFEPRGIIKLIYSSASSIVFTSSLENIRLTALSGKSSIFFNELFIIENIVLLVSTASLPPFRITVLDDFIAKQDICEMTSGLASKITPMTPIGQLTFCKTIPSAILLSKSTLLTGSFNNAISLTPCIMSLSLFSSNLSLLYADSVINFSESNCFALSRSF